MASGVRLTKAERDLLRRWLEAVTHGDDAKEAKVASGVLTKLELSELPKKRHGISSADAIGAFREVLGARLTVPPNGAGGVYAQMSRRLEALGLTRMDCVSVAKTASVLWDGRIKAESLVRQADSLLADAQLEMQGEQFPPRKPASSPVELADDDR